MWNITLILGLKVFSRRTRGSRFGCDTLEVKLEQCGQSNFLTKIENQRRFARRAQVKVQLEVLDSSSSIMLGPQIS